MAAPEFVALLEPVQIRLANPMGDSVIGNTLDFDSSKSRFEPWSPSHVTILNNMRINASPVKPEPSKHPILAAAAKFIMEVAIVEEVLRHPENIKQLFKPVD